MQSNTVGAVSLAGALIDVEDQLWVGCLSVPYKLHTHTHSTGETRQETQTQITTQVPELHRVLLSPAASHTVTHEAHSSHTHLQPEVLIHSTGNHASLKEKHCPLVVAFRHLKVKVVVPVLQLVLVQWFGMEIRTLDLPTQDKQHSVRGTLVHLPTISLHHMWCTPSHTQAQTHRCLKIFSLVHLS